MKNALFLLFVLLSMKVAGQNSNSFESGKLELSGSFIKFTEKKSNAHFYNSGFGIGVGINSITAKHYILSINANYNCMYLNDTQYRKYDTSVDSALSIEGNSLQFISVMPTAKYIPWSNSKIAPYVFGGLGILQGVSDGKVVKKFAHEIQNTKYPIGLRMIVAYGVGAQYAISEKFNLLIEAKQNLEVFENSQGKDLYYNTKKVDQRYQYLTIHLGLSFKMK